MLSSSAGSLREIFDRAPPVHRCHRLSHPRMRLPGGRRSAGVRERRGLCTHLSLLPIGAVLAVSMSASSQPSRLPGCLSSCLRAVRSCELGAVRSAGRWPLGELGTRAAQIPAEELIDHLGAVRGHLGRRLGRVIPVGVFHPDRAVLRPGLIWHAPKSPGCTYRFQRILCGVRTHGIPWCTYTYLRPRPVHHRPAVPGPDRTSGTRRAAPRRHRATDRRGRRGRDRLPPHLLRQVPARGHLPQLCAQLA
jgi:hypothetical protein